jgi:hypothetical protein
MARPADTPKPANENTRQQPECVNPFEQNAGNVMSELACPLRSRFRSVNRHLLLRPGMIAGCVLALAGSTLADDLDRPPINYSSVASSDSVARLFQKIDSAKATIEWNEKQGYLASLLKNLDIPLSSQVLVFSRTSLQRSRIGARKPRALYFNDEVAVGYCQHGTVLEVAAADANLGMVFYTVAQEPGKRATLTRQTDTCLTCHGSSANQGFPGYVARSVAADRSGEPIFSRGTRRVDHTTPFAERWGGWYVTGKSGGQKHQGNQFFDELTGNPSSESQGNVFNIVDLKPFFNVTHYLTPHSDLVALMVLEHQGEAYNRLTRANFLTRLALHEQAELNRAFGKPANEPRESITHRIQWACEPLVQYFLFCDEAPLKEPVAGSSTFAREFAGRGPFDSRGRSLREFDLRSRIFRYPMSYLIYSRAFEGLPAEAKEQVYLRLWQVLSGEDHSRPFEHLTPADRQAILEIVRDTRPGLPAYWRK